MRLSSLRHRAAGLLRLPSCRLAALIIAAWVLTLLDVALTHHGLQIGAISEANPVLAALFHVSPALALAFVSLYVGLACVALWLARHKVAWLPPAVRMVVAVKTAVLGAHAVWVLGLA